MKIRKKDIRSLVNSLCKLMCYGGILKYRIEGRVIEGLFDDNGTEREFRILLAFEDNYYYGIMATVEYGFITRTYAQISKRKWEAL